MSESRATANSPLREKEDCAEGLALAADNLVLFAVAFLIVSNQPELNLLSQNYLALNYLKNLSQSKDDQFTPHRALERALDKALRA